jgi:NaMN:DMB phosphoribosyltransferase
MDYNCDIRFRKGVHLMATFTNTIHGGVQNLAQAETITIGSMVLGSTSTAQDVLAALAHLRAEVSGSVIPGEAKQSVQYDLQQAEQAVQHRDGSKAEGLLQKAAKVLTSVGGAADAATKIAGIAGLVAKFV